MDLSKQSPGNQTIREALEDFVQCAEIQDRGGIADPGLIDALTALCERVGYGNVMTTVSRLWRNKDNNGAFTVGHCVGTVRSQILAGRAALKSDPLTYTRINVLGTVIDKGVCKFHPQYKAIEREAALKGGRQ